MRMRILVTGAAGFIGYHLSERLLERGDEVVGVDSINDYYDPTLKQARLDRLAKRTGFRFERLDIADRDAVTRLFQTGFKRVAHLAAQAGVRYSITNPHAYVDANIVGFMNVLENSRQTGVEHLVYASSSSVYGLNTTMPFSIHHNVDHPVSLYAASKKANELMAHSYSHLFRLPTTGLRFFTVYGPWGRPDMALFKFTKGILAGEPIDVYNGGKMRRDFTFVDDIVEGVVRSIDRIAAPNTSWNPAKPDPGSSSAPYRVYNIGSNRPVELSDFIAAIERNIGKKAVLRNLPMQLGDVPATAAEVSELISDLGYSPKFTVDEGIGRFVAWYREYYRV